MRERLTNKQKRRWLFKQLLPLHYCTISRPQPEQRRYQVSVKLNVDAVDAEHAQRQVSEAVRAFCGSIDEPKDVTDNVYKPQLVQWRMFMGRCFKVRRTVLN